MRNTPYQPAWAPAPPEELEWRRRAACLEHDPEIFFPVWNKEANWEQPRAVCRSCDVADACLAFAEKMEADTPGTREGMWGGFTPDERRRAHRNRLRRERVAAKNTEGEEA